MTVIRQTDFGAGELAPSLYGATSSSLYARGLRRCEGWVPTKQGQVMTRPGWEYLGEVKLVEGLGNTPTTARNAVRLVPFIISDTEAYLLEFGNLYVRVWKDGVYLGLEYATSFDTTRLPRLRYAQVGDVLTLVCGGNEATGAGGLPPFELARTSTAPTFALTQVSYTRLPTRHQTVEGVQLSRPRLVNGTLVDGKVPGAGGNEDFQTGSAGRLYNNSEPGTDSKEAIIRVPKVRTYLTNDSLLDNETGRVIETRPVEVTEEVQAPTSLPSAPILEALNSRFIIAEKDANAVLRWLPVQPGDTPGQVYDARYALLSHNVFAGDGDLFGFLGSTDGVTFKDDGETPQYLIPPPRGTQPFGTSGDSKAKPACVGYYQDRIFFGGPWANPGDIFGSAAGDYYDFDIQRRFIPPRAAVRFTLASRRRERVRALATLFGLVAGTDGGIYYAQGGGPNGEVTADSITAWRLVDEAGMSSLPFLATDNSLLYVRAKGRGVRALMATQDAGLAGRDVSFHAEHLFVGFSGTGAVPTKTGLSIRDWAFQEDPWGIVWAVREDGLLLSLTFTAGGYAAWARHPTDGAVLSVCAVPEKGQDAVYGVVRRFNPAVGNTWNIERLSTRQVNGHASEACALDAAKAYEVAPGTSQLTGLPDCLKGRSDVYLCGAGLPTQGPLQVSAAGVVDLPSPLDTAPETLKGNLGNGNVLCFVGLKYRPVLEVLGLVAGELGQAQKVVRALGFEVDNARGLWTGQDLEHLTEWPQRTVATSWNAPAPSTTTVRMKALGTWDREARAVLVQEEPLHTALSAITRDVEVGGMS